MTTGIPNKARVNYPCNWGFKVIGANEDIVRQATLVCLQEECEGRPYTLELSNVSGKGKYVSLNLTLKVEDEVERNEIFTALAESPDIMMVI